MIKKSELKITLSNFVLHDSNYQSYLEKKAKAVLLYQEENTPEPRYFELKGGMETITYSLASNNVLMETLSMYKKDQGKRVLDEMIVTLTFYDDAPKQLEESILSLIKAN